MPVNPYFNFSTFASEQSLVDDLTIEAIQIYGHSAHYITREVGNMDHLFGEDPLMYYENAQEIEIYLKSSASFGGTSETLSKFGLEIQDDAIFLVSATRWRSVMASAGFSRPREEDIIFIEFSPNNRYLFEIQFVEDKEQLFQLGKLYTYELRCSVLTYSHERVRTQVPEANAVAERGAYKLVFDSLTDGSGDYVLGETVFQGDNFLVATATGTVMEWNPNTWTLKLVSITGEFTVDLSIIGITSEAAYMPTAVPSTMPTDDPLTDNQLLKTEGDTIITPHSNPRYNS